MIEKLLAEFKELLDKPEFKDVLRLEFTYFEYGTRRAALIELSDGSKRAVEWSL